MTISKKIAVICLILAVASLTVPVFPALAASGVEYPPLSERDVWIDSRDDNFIYVEGAAYQIQRDTSFISPDGGRTTMWNLPVPCKARIKYFFGPEGTPPQVIEINILPVIPE